MPLRYPWHLALTTRDCWDLACMHSSMASCVRHGAFAVAGGFCLDKLMQSMQSMRVERCPSRGWHHFCLSFQKHRRCVGWRSCRLPFSERFAAAVEGSGETRGFRIRGRFMFISCDSHTGGWAGCHGVGGSYITIPFEDVPH